MIEWDIWDDVKSMVESGTEFLRVGLSNTIVAAAINKIILVVIRKNNRINESTK